MKKINWTIILVFVAFVLVGLTVPAKSNEGRNYAGTPTPTPTPSKCKLQPGGSISCGGPGSGGFPERLDKLNNQLISENFADPKATPTPTQCKDRPYCVCDSTGKILACQLFLKKSK